MTATQTQIDWDTVRERLARYQAQSAESECIDRDRLTEVFRERARNLEQRGRHETTTVSQVSIVAFRFGKERFGIRLTDLEQVFPQVPVTPVPGACELLLGVANLNGTLRSVVNPNAVLQTSATSLGDGYIVLLRAKGCSLALWVEAIDGVYEVDFSTLVAIDEVASGKTPTLTLGITGSKIIILDTAAVISHVREQIVGCEH